VVNFAFAHALWFSCGIRISSFAPKYSASVEPPA
jgi:hypothetical protein